jgi:hypothetical protein
MVEAGAGYVQDERYAAGAGMRRSGFFQVSTAYKDEQYAVQN